MTRSRRSSSAAFTLLELILVLVIICTILAMAAPSLRGWSHGSQMRDAADQFLTIARWARATATSEAKIHRLNVDTAGGKYWVTVQQGGEFANAQSTFGRVYQMPDGIRIELTDLQNKPVESVDFFPSGRSATGRVRISSQTDGGTLEIECPTPVEGYGYATAQHQ